LTKNDRILTKSTARFGQVATTIRRTAHNKPSQKDPNDRFFSPQSSRLSMLLIVGTRGTKWNAAQHGTQCATSQKIAAGLSARDSCLKRRNCHRDLGRITSKIVHLSLPPMRLWFIVVPILARGGLHINIGITAWCRLVNSFAFVDFLWFLMRLLVIIFMPKQQRLHHFPNRGQVSMFAQHVRRVLLDWNLVNVDDAGCDCPSHSMVGQCHPTLMHFRMRNGSRIDDRFVVTWQTMHLHRQIAKQQGAKCSNNTLKRNFPTLMFHH